VSRSTPAQVDLARRLLAHEAAAGSADPDATTAAGRVYDKLHAHMAPLVGVAGVQMLFVRSAKLAQGEFAQLSDVSTPEGSTKVRERLQAQDPAVAPESAVTLFAIFFALLTNFIGERLTTEILRRAWPTNKETAPMEPKP